MNKPVKCSRCGGAGGWVGWPGFTCYLCRGTGSRVRLSREERAQIKSLTCRSCRIKPGEYHAFYCEHAKQVVGQETECEHDWCPRAAARQESAA